MIFVQLSHQLALLRNLLANIDNQQFTHCINHLGRASIGSHTRHAIELLQCAVDGHSSGSVDYVNRVRNLQLEQDKTVALAALEKLEMSLTLADKPLLLVTEETMDTQALLVNTTYFREIVYNTEHVIHHLALIKVALIEMELDIVTADFGMAYATLKYKASLQQQA
jgi:hypothetical protein